MQSERHGKYVGIKVSHDNNPNKLQLYNALISVFFSELRYDSLCKQIIKDMNTYGMCVVDDFLGMTHGLGILNEGK